MRRILMSCTELAVRPDCRIFDCRHQLSDPQWGWQVFREGHLPGAVHAHLDDVLSGRKNGANGRHPLPRPEALARWLGEQGLRNSDPVVVYDDAGGAMAARMWWLLRWLGHDEVSILDGGLPAWLDSGFALERDCRRFEPAGYVAQPRAGMTVATADVLANLATADAVLIDARGRSRYAGEEEPIDPVAGHIPGALNRPYTDNLQAGGRFKPAVLLREEFEALLCGTDGSRLVAQCGSGVTACHHLAALEIAGIGPARLYPGSWSEWCADPARPIRTGAQP